MEKYRFDNLHMHSLLTLMSKSQSFEFSDLMLSERVGKVGINLFIKFKQNFCIHMNILKVIAIEMHTISLLAIIMLHKFNLDMMLLPGK